MLTGSRDRPSPFFRLRLVGIVHDAAQDGRVLTVLLRDWFGLPPDAKRDGDRLALTQLASSEHHALLLAARDPLVYLRVAVRDEAARLATETEIGARRWRRWLTFSDGIEDIAWNASDLLAARRGDGLDPATLHLRREELVLPRSQRPRPGLARLLAVAPDLASLTPREALLLRLLAVGIPPADAIRASGSTRSAYSGLLHKARRRRLA